MHSLRANVAKIVAVSLLASTTMIAGASKPRPASSLIVPTPGQAVGVIFGIAAVGAAIGVGVYYAARHHQSVTGCASLMPDGLRLESEVDRKVYALTGDLAAVKTGERIRVSGKKLKSSGAVQLFLVEKLPKDFGPCKVQAETR
jgi:hypothetical protein